MAVAKKLFHVDNIAAVDMPLERTHSDILESVIEKVQGKSNIEVIPCGIKELKKLVKEVAETRNIISLVGISDPKLGSLIDGEGEEILRNIIKGKDIRISNKSEKQIVLKIFASKL